MRDVSYKTWVARGLARALLADAQALGGTSLAALRARAIASLGAPFADLDQLIEPLAKLSRLSWDKLDVTQLAKQLELSDAFHLAFSEGHKPVIRRLILRSPQMRPVPLGLENCKLPELTTTAQLAQWLGVETDALLWLAPEKPLGAEHYRYQLQAKRLGGLRLLEIPKVRIKHVQRRILTGLLDQVPAHEAAHGFIQGKSVVDHAQAHVGRDVVIRFDLQDFFGSVRRAQIQAIWQTLGYPVGVAQTLATLCTHRTSEMVVQRLADDGGLDWLGAKRLRMPHLPQGAPTSPALANLSAFQLDLRLEGLAYKFGAVYTRYADDLVFSGAQPLRQQFRILQAWVAAIVEAEGFKLHPDKTHCLPKHRQQRITGVVVNQQLNLPRKEFDRLKACLHQCSQQGPASQNRLQLDDFKAHLLGRIGWVRQLNPNKVHKLMRLFERIEWA